jgi:hypothetical protein
MSDVEISYEGPEHTFWDELYSPQQEAKFREMFDVVKRPIREVTMTGTLVNEPGLEDLPDEPVWLDPSED